MKKTLPVQCFQIMVPRAFQQDVLNILITSNCMEKITDHEFKHGCFKDCPYDHSEHQCEYYDENVIQCRKLQSEHLK